MTTMTEPKTTAKMYTVTEVAEMLGLKPRTVRYYVKQGWLKPTQYNSIRLQFDDASIENLRKVMEGRMEKERMRRSAQMKKMRDDLNK